MSWLVDSLSYLFDPASWTRDGLGEQLVDHLGLAALSLLVATLVAVPVGLVLGHTGRGGALAINISNIGRAVPTFAVLVIFVLLPQPFGANTASFVLALALFSIPPLLTNTYTGMREVDRSAVDAARGLGMSPWQMLVRVELPLATPLLMVGLRIAAVQVVATTTVVGLVSTRTLGAAIRGGIATQDQPRVIAGALLVAAVAVVVELALAALERRVGGASRRRSTPPRRGRRAGRLAASTSSAG
ncbi:ABC transporter permease [uncultured Pseudokineococcus sp.]|uniref:ABC transporter permease n=1 Tax=uncultured Pseudokineococcus sp. TaxID=1642928 RepID=UPI0026296DCA|nr:ABC transporter permease [uncultured Pseudokineococcus sp.]